MIKKLKDLEQNGLIEKPVWEHRYFLDEEYVRPSDKTELTEDTNLGYIVLTDFVLINGIKLIGFCSPLDTSGLDYIQPVIFTPDGQLIIFKENDWTNAEKLTELEKLNLTADQVFPITYVTRIPCDGSVYRGTILDFNQGK